ncbi:SycD/LcrH family type III secretion system chaperone [Ottowia thiooxydans]|uniref:Type III secretion system low calcium response chaperone LcrH/SycD n=1 Tax=Ottowia thiooxydans TaxID=219182 RepID=A0ABV2QGE2_9BURK
MKFKPLDELSEEQALAQIKEAQQWLGEGGSLGDAMDIPVAQREALYQVGHGFYTQARYQEAFKVFSMLVIYDHLNPRYLMALAGAAQMQGLYEDALQHYSTAALTMEDDPTPLIHSADCLMALGRTDLAQETLGLAIELAENDDKFSAVKKRAEAVLAMMDAKVGSPAP